MQTKISKTFLSQAFITLGDILYPKVVKVFGEFALKSGKEIPHTKSQTNFSEHNFLENLDVFSEEEKFEILTELSQIGPSSIFPERKLFREKLHQEYPHLKKNGRYETFHETIEKTTHFLANYPKALDRYKLATQYFYQESDLQTLVITLYNSIEELMREVQKRDWQWDQSHKELKKTFEGKLNSHFVKMFFDLLKSYEKYQNENARHRNNINAAEVEFIFEMSSVFLRQIVNLYKVSK